MDLQEEFDRLKRYLLQLALIAVLSVVLIGGGFALGGIFVADRLFLEGASIRTILRIAGPGIALQGVGVLVWLIGSVAALYSVLYEQFSATMHRDLTSDDLQESLKKIVGDRVEDIQSEFDDIHRQLEQEDRNRDR